MNKVKIFTVEPVWLIAFTRRIQKMLRPKMTNDIQMWHTWFAWYPVITFSYSYDALNDLHTNEYRIAWLRRVYRCFSHQEMFPSCYEIGDPDFEKYLG